MSVLETVCLNMKTQPTFDEINSLFSNNAPDVAWRKTNDIIRRISPGYDFSLLGSIYEDVLHLFRGEYMGYTEIRTLYHDLPHTLDVTLCAIRLMHGIHVSGTTMHDDDITQAMMATLMHDVGYAQVIGEESGTGAQFTQTHVQRGIAFMRRYVEARRLPAELAERLAPIMLCTDPVQKFAQIEFPDQRARRLAQIVGTADLAGQMADRTYPEKLLFLYLEFKEAGFGNYQNMLDMLRQTKKFYQLTREKLDSVYQGIYAMLSFHFQDVYGVDNNYYMESIEKNIAYLDKVIECDEAAYLTMLKRGGIAEKSRKITVPD